MYFGLCEKTLCRPQNGPPQALSLIHILKLKKSMLGMVKDMTLEGMAGMASSMGIGGKASADPEQGKRMLITLNEMLNKIKK